MTLSKNIEQTDDEIVVIRCFSKVRFPNDFFGNTIDQIVSYFTPNSFTESVNIFACVVSEYCHGLHKFFILRYFGLSHEYLLIPFCNPVC